MSKESHFAFNLGQGKQKQLQLTVTAGFTGMPFPVPRRISGISVGRAGRITADLFVHKKFIPSTAEETTTDDINNNAFNNIYK